MTRPFIKQKRFSARSAGAPGALPLACVEGISAFETLRARRGRLIAAAEHVRRLDESCRGLGRVLPMPRGRFERWLSEALAESGHSNALIRVSVHWAEEPWVTALVRPFTGHPRRLYEEGVALRTAVVRRPSPRSRDAQIKCSDYASAVIAYLDAQGGPEAHELILLAPDQTVAEGSVSNLFIVKGRTVLTPSAASGILRGVTRALAMAAISARGFKVRETPLTRHDLYTADECFLTNTSSGILPVVEIDGRRIGPGKPGPVARAFAHTEEEKWSRSKERS